MECRGEAVIERETSLVVSYPAGIENEYTKNISLQKYAIVNFYLTLRFIVREDD